MYVRGRLDTEDSEYTLRCKVSVLVRGRWRRTESSYNGAIGGSSGQMTNRKDAASGEMMVETQRITEESEKHGQLQLGQGHVRADAERDQEPLYCTCVPCSVRGICSCCDRTMTGSSQPVTPTKILNLKPEKLEMRKNVRQMGQDARAREEGYRGSTNARVRKASSGRRARRDHASPQWSLGRDAMTATSMANRRRARGCARGVFMLAWGQG